MGNPHGNPDPKENTPLIKDGGEFLATISFLLASKRFSRWLGEKIRIHPNNPGWIISVMEFAFRHESLLKLVIGGLQVKDLEEFLFPQKQVLVCPSAFSLSPGGQPCITALFDPKSFVKEACLRGGWNLEEISPFPTLSPKTAAAFQELGGFMPVFFPAKSSEDLKNQCSGFIPPKFRKYPKGSRLEIQRFPLSSDPNGTWRMVEIRGKPKFNDPDGYGKDDQIPSILGLRTQTNCLSPRFCTAWKDVQAEGLRPLSERLGVPVRLPTAEELTYLDNYLNMLSNALGVLFPDIGGGSSELCANQDGRGYYLVSNNGDSVLECFHTSTPNSEGYNNVAFRLIADLPPAS